MQPITRKHSSSGLIAMEPDAIEVQMLDAGTAQTDRSITPCKKATKPAASASFGAPLLWGLSGMQGYRRSMEDACCATKLKIVAQNYGRDIPVSLFAVFDGHGEKSRFLAIILIDKYYLLYL